MVANGSRGMSELMAKEAVRELEARFDARLQAVSARFVRCDNGFIGIDSRLDDAQHRHGALEQRVSTRFEIIDGALARADAQIEALRERVHAADERHGQAQQRSDRLGRHILAAVLGSTMLILILWATTTALLLTNH